MNWLEITINTSPERIDALISCLSDLGIEGIIVENESEYAEFFENNRKYWDYIDESLLSAIHGVCRIKFYLEDSSEERIHLSSIAAALPDEKLISGTICDEDWENNWRQYYKPVAVGEKLLVVPEWEDPEDSAGRVVLRLDPGLTFGTGTHATTQMCLRALEAMPLDRKAVLDLGCGSGILAIAALLLGAESAVCCDIDEKAPSVVRENALLNAINPDRMEIFSGDAVSDPQTIKQIGVRKYGVILANIVADVIISLSAAIPGLLSKGGIFVCSGIIDGRETEVEKALDSAGLNVLSHFEQDGWHSFSAVSDTDQTRIG